MKQNPYNQTEGADFVQMNGVKKKEQSDIGSSREISANNGIFCTVLNSSYITVIFKGVLMIFIY